MRRYLRHPTDYPVDIHLSDLVPPDREYLRNISRGGLCFTATVSVEPGTIIHIEIPIARPVFETDGLVAWCQATAEGYEIGVRFAKQHPRNQRLVEQVCQVEHFKREIWLHDGRHLTGEEAAVEWLRQHHAIPGH
jgi:hypothetical protein